nr:uncharacterized protein At3g49720-like isoform X2 [Physcomitrium patens]XP_024389975.1 uncharacterized protein At3g49720-like isoform X2 [Physcomitrium patens]|eukprot:XP_024389974.1 uncharacterized protein At3g49720-like isoform X2 [Physcomitrella patens]
MEIWVTFLFDMEFSAFYLPFLFFQSPQSNDPEIKVTEVKDTGAKEVTQTTPDNDIEEEPQLVWDGVKASSQSECTASVCGVIDVLQDMYGKNMLRLLHIGPGTCGIVSKLLEESSSEVWGVQPFPMKSPVQKKCQTLVKKGLIRVAEVNQVLPYRSRSFSFVLVTDILDVMKKRDLNTTLPELSRLSAHDLVVIVGNGRPQPIENTALAGQLGKFNKPRTRDWWLQQFHAAGLKEDEEKKTHFEVAVSERGNKSSFHIFHLIVPSFSSPI